MLKEIHEQTSVVRNTLSRSFTWKQVLVPIFLVKAAHALLAKIKTRCQLLPVALAITQV